MRTLLISLVFAGLSLAQVISGIHAPVTRSVGLAADEATFNVTVTARLDSTVQQVKQALQNAGAPNPTVVATNVGAPNRFPISGGSPELVYSATFTVITASSAEVAKGLLNLSTHLTDPLNSLQLNVRYAASQAKVDELWQSLLPQMREEAQKSAVSLAAAAGVKLGRLRAANENPANGIYLAARNGDFSRIGGVIGPYPVSIPYTFRLELVYETIP